MTLVLVEVTAVVEVKPCHVSFPTTPKTFIAILMRSSTQSSQRHLTKNEVLVMQLTMSAATQNPTVYVKYRNVREN